MRNFILSSDWSTDVDDVVALKLCLLAHKSGHINLLGVNIDDNMLHLVASMDGFMQTENCPLPIGFDRTAKEVPILRPTYQRTLKEYAKRYSDNLDVPDSVPFLRKLIAEADGPVEIMEIGYLQSLHRLMTSSPDEITPLSGMELVKTKVKKFWMMAGRWDVRRGIEHNLCGTKASKIAAGYIFKNCPVPITFLGWEVGHSVRVGGNLDENDVLGKAILDYGCRKGAGRCAYDPMLALLAIIGDEKKAGYATVTGRATINRYTGVNRFHKGEGMHTYIIKDKPDDYYKNQINSLISGELTFDKLLEDLK